MALQLARAFSSKLSGKGLIIIAIPTLFSLVFILSLMLLLNQASAQLARQTRAKEIIANASGLGQAVVAAIFEGYDSSFSPGVSKLDALQGSKKLVLERFSALDSAVPPGGRQGELVEHLGKSLNTAIRLVEERNGDLDSKGQIKLSRLAGLQKLLQTRKQLRVIVADLQQDSSELIDIERRGQSAQPISYERFRSLIDLLLYGGIAVDIFLAVGLMSYFSKDISDRLNVLMDNSHRLVEEKELNPVVSGNDEITQMDTVFHEMASKLAASRASERHLADRMRSIVETIPLGLVVVGGGDKIVSLSQGAERMFKTSSDSLQGSSLFELIDTADTKSGSNSIVDFMNQANGSAQRFQAKNGDSASFPCEVICAEYSTAEMNGKLLVVTDITERQQIERLKQSFIAMVSHELRSPLTAIQVCLELLSRRYFGALTEEGSEAVEMAGENIKRLVRLVNEILDAERLESGKIAVVLSKTELSKVLQLSVGSVQSLAEASAIEIEVTGEEMVLDADQDKLVQVVINLLSNAIKFSPDSSKIQVSSNLKTASLVEVRVKDLGRGIPPDQLEMVFERFHQVSLEDSKEMGGTGLGLAICKSIIEAHGGEIGVESALGAGSTETVK